MIKEINQRLLIWAEASEDRLCGNVSNMWDSICGAASSSNAVSRVAFDLDVEETEKAVRSLPERLGRVVVGYYLDRYQTQEYKAKGLGISKSTLFRLLDEAHILLQSFFRKDKISC